MRYLASVLALIVVASPATGIGQTSKTMGLIEARSSGYVSYQLNGTGSSDTMDIAIRNKTDTVYVVEIKEGTLLEPRAGDVQNMVVTKTLEVTIHPHEVETTELDVSCLDISKEAPSPSDIYWTASSSARLLDFLNCVESGVPTGDSRRSSVVQLALWKARGATEDQMVAFFVRYQHVTNAKARTIVQRLYPLLGALESQCGSLRDVA